jgi:putative Holliday junction resolvase
LGQTITKTSSPLIVINVAREGKEIWNTISNLIDEWKPDQLLVGKPLNMDGTPSDMMKKVDPFFQKLQKISDIPCELVDERLTSFEAKQLMQKDSKDDRIDDLAAKIFLDNWIEHYVNSN